MNLNKFTRLALILSVTAFAVTPLARGGQTEVLDQNLAPDSGSKEVIAGTAEGTGRFQRFPFRVSVALRTGYDDNVLTTHFDRRGSFFQSAGLNLSYDFGNARTQLSLGAGAGITYYFDRNSGQDYDVNANVGFSITHKATPRLTLAATVYATYQVQPDFSLNIGLDRRSGNYFYTGNKFSVAYLWTPRFSTVTSYTFSRVQYDSAVIGAYEDRFEHTIGQEFRFLVQPTTSLVFEGRVQFVDYDTIARDSVSYFALAGVDHTFNPRLSLSLRGGVQFRDYDNSENRTEPYFEGTLNYALGRRTSLTFTNRYSIEEPDVPGSPSRTTYRTGLQLKYGITPRISTNVSVFYKHDNNQGFADPNFPNPAFKEDSVSVGVGFRYAINRNIALDLGYDHTEVFSDILLREYSRNRYFGGVTVSF